MGDGRGKKVHPGLVFVVLAALAVVYIVVMYGLPMFLESVRQMFRAFFS